MSGGPDHGQRQAAIPAAAQIPAKGHLDPRPERRSRSDLCDALPSDRGLDDSQLYGFTVITRVSVADSHVT